MGGASSKATRKLPTTAPSKALPTSKPSWAGARTPHPNPLYPDSTQSPPHPPSSSSSSSSSFPSTSGPLPSFARSSQIPPETSRASASRSMKPTSKSNDFDFADQGAEPRLTGRSKPGFSGEKDDALLKDARDPQFMSNLSRLGQVKIQDTGQFKVPSIAQQTLSSRNISPELTTYNSIPPPGYLTSPMLFQLLDNLKSCKGDVKAEEKIYKEYGMKSSDMQIIRKWVNSPSIGEEVSKVTEGEKEIELRAVWV